MYAHVRYVDDMLMTLKDDAATVNALVRRTPRKSLEERRFGEWSAVELIAHVTFIAEVMRGRIERCLVEDRPAVAAVADGALTDEREPVALARRLQRAYAAIVALLMRPGTPERPATHPQWGDVSAGFFAAHQATHGHDHIAELATAFPPR